MPRRKTPKELEVEIERLKRQVEIEELKAKLEAGRRKRTR